MMKFLRAVLAVATLAAVVPFGAPDAHAAMTNSEARAKLLAYLTRIGQSPNEMLSGQNAGHADGSQGDQYISGLVTSTGKYPAILGIDLGFKLVGSVPGGAIDYMTSYWNNGGLITLSMSPENPMTGGDPWDVSNADFDQIFSPGTQANQRWMQVLDNVYGVLNRLKQAGVIVLWRPLHEANGGWFWWGGNDNGRWVTPAQYKRLWTQMYDYFVNVKGLDNLLWVYAPNCQDSSDLKSVTYYYPGSAYVDVVGLDCYTNDMSIVGSRGSYTQAVSLGKPVAMTEWGPQNNSNAPFDNRFTLGLKTAYPRLSYFMYWHSWPGNKRAIVDFPNANALMKDTNVLSLGQLDWRTQTP
ncbi:MAG: hypothetical protein GC151_18865 [Betaproteobacteria bacterium]|nr:hypothetical protein [Betaproteobacteria bacterium]